MRSLPYLFMVNDQNQLHYCGVPKSSKNLLKLLSRSRKKAIQTLYQSFHAFFIYLQHSPITSITLQSIKPKDLRLRGLLEQVGAKALEAQRLRVELVGLRVAVGHLSFGSPLERGMEAHESSQILTNH